MQRLFHKETKDGPLVAAPLEELEERRAKGEWIWLEVSAASPGEVAEVGERFGFDRLGLEDVLDEVQFPKMDDYGDYLFVILHGLAAGGQRLETSELDGFMGSKYLVTFRDAELPGLEEIIEKALRNPSTLKAAPTACWPDWPRRPCIATCRYSIRWRSASKSWKTGPCRAIPG